MDNLEYIKNIESKEFVRLSDNDVRRIIKDLCEYRGRMKCYSKEDYKQCLSEIVDAVFYGK